MALDPGSTLGVYVLAEQIGAGGMGEVYRATDSKLGREVAIKTLPAALAADKDRLARFEREAKVLAALNHAHIASVHSLDEQDGIVFIVMELVDGETLESKLEQGPLALDEALHISLQIAEALEAAHEKGVVHRDLKPANIMLNRNGQVKVLDFGLAKAFTGNPNEASPIHSPALSVAMTQQGFVLGTAGYMSPEQASGQATDQRADVWAFGAVLYEMLTGQPVFSGETVPHILAAVLQTEPKWELLPQALHPRLKLLLERCLTKRPRNRLHSIADARVELEAVLADPGGAKLAPPVDTATTRLSAARLIAVAAAAAIVAAAAGWLLRPVPEPERLPVVRFSMPLPADQIFTTPLVSMIAVSPDGTRIAYVANQQLYQRNLAETEARPVVGTRNATFAIGAATPAYSPDGQWLVYLDAETNLGTYEIKRVPTSGGAPVLLTTADGVANFQHGLTWPTADSIMFANADGVVRIPANGGAVEVLAARLEEERLYSPQLLPGGDTVLFTRVPGALGTLGGFEAAQVVVQSVGGDDRTIVWQGGAAARYVPTGHLVYAQGSALFAIAFDPVARAVSGGPVPLMDGLRRSGNGFTDTANFGISDTGTLVHIPGALGDEGFVERIETTVVWVDREGREEPLPIRPDDYTHARVSPDGTKIALVVGASLGRSTVPSIWIYDTETRNLRLLTTDPQVHDGPVWSSDSNRIYFRTPGAGALDINVIDLETGEVSLVAEGTTDGFPFPLPWSLSPDEDTLAIVNAQSQTDVDVATLDLTRGQLTRLLFGEGQQNEPSISPNGAWLAHQDGATVGGASEIYIRPFPGVYRTLIPVGPGASPVFSRDGTELFFLNDNGIYSARVEYEPSLRVSAPSPVLQSSDYMWQLFGRTWDPDPSGERFIVPRNPDTDAEEVDDGNDDRRIDIVLNWFEELETRVPTQ